MDNFISLSQGHYHRSAHLASILKPQPVDIVQSAMDLIQIKMVAKGKVQKPKREIYGQAEFRFLSNLEKLF